MKQSQILKATFLDASFIDALLIYFAPLPLPAGINNPKSINLLAVLAAVNQGGFVWRTTEPSFFLYSRIFPGNDLNGKWLQGQGLNSRSKIC